MQENSLIHVGKHLDKKAKVNIQIFGLINWETDNYNILIAFKSQEVKAQLVSRLAYNTMMIVDASSSPPVSHVI